MKNIGLFVLMLFTISFVNNVSAQNWIPDSLFGSDSRLSINAGGSETFSNFLLQPDGKVVACGYDSDSGYYHNIMIRFDQCGLIDSSFGTNGVVNHRFDNRNMGRHYALQSDGKFLVAGIQSTSNAGSQQFPFVARYNSDGSVDTNFANSGTHVLQFDNVSPGTFYSVKEMTDGRILCGGTCNIVGIGAIRFMSDGSLDTTFSSDGKVLHLINCSFMPSRAILMQNGKIVIAGRNLDGVNNAHFVAVCYDSTGMLDTTFATGGLLTDSVNLKYIYADAYSDIQSDDKIVMACTRVPVSDGIEVIRFTPAGVLDNTFGTNGHVNLTFPNMECTGVKVLSNGKILVMGEATNACAVQLLSNGTLDSALATNGFLSGIDLYPSGTDALNDVLELGGPRLIMGAAWPDHNFRRYSTQSNVPYISGNASLLQTTGTGMFQWFLNDTIILGATSSAHIPLVGGNYTVEITDDLGCTYLSDIFSVTGVGLNEYQSVKYLNIFPVPVSSELTVQSSGLIHEIKVMDMLGQEVYSLEKLESSSCKLPTSKLLPGVYILRAIINGHSITRKLAKE